VDVIFFSCVFFVSIFFSFYAIHLSLVRMGQQIVVAVKSDAVVLLSRLLNRVHVDHGYGQEARLIR